MLSKMPSQTSALGESHPNSPQTFDLSEFTHTDMLDEPFPEHSGVNAPVAESESCT